MKKVFMVSVLATMLLWGGISSAKELASQVIRVKAPEVIADSHTGTSTEIFMELVNKGNQAHTLIAAVSDAAKQTQLHKYVRVNNKEVMHQVDSIVIKKKGEKNLKPGGFHIMLMELKDTAKFGSSIPITLVFKDGSTIRVNAVVDKTQAYLNEMFGEINKS